MLLSGFHLIVTRILNGSVDLIALPCPLGLTWVISPLCFAVIFTFCCRNKPSATAKLQSETPIRRETGHPLHPPPTVSSYVQLKPPNDIEQSYSNHDSQKKEINDCCCKKKTDSFQVSTSDDTTTCTRNYEEQEERNVEAY